MKAPNVFWQTGLTQAKWHARVIWHFALTFHMLLRPVACCWNWSCNEYLRACNNKL